MNIEITYHNQTDTIALPPGTDFVGLSLSSVLNMNNGFPKRLGGAPVVCTPIDKSLPDGTVLTVYCYQLGGKAKVLSLRQYTGLSCFDIQNGDVRITCTI